ncbi:hypothetical protein FRC0316_00185 [Corynebacterium diphtheriae]|nr:hypothetical protein FRC0016_00109 [Corynebacterium diphtheriae]CAB0785036.1 hypothetical protein FRC0213_00112 [Corynebacterium diphtheriae]CAB0785364.1 hypothetical protein FRC0191_00175 [Corynebacterium diphtheriae]CAB0830947.1 hypothetical protein FRC0295_00162 [Corynebacterium diphtheriae]CAB0831221.1 hypothetical protein FRC0316_00185 [Corynebacterium diphtheriae]
MEEIPDYGWNYKQFCSQDPKRILSFNSISMAKAFFIRIFSHKAFYINAGLNVFHTTHARGWGQRLAVQYKISHTSKLF